MGVGDGTRRAGAPAACRSSICRRSAASRCHGTAAGCGSRSTARSTTSSSCAAELEAAGYRFRSQTDTEVILAAYDRWGVDCVERLVGMFAFAIWDAPRRRLWLVRDRLGKKPLYYAEANGTLPIRVRAESDRRRSARSSATSIRTRLRLYLRYGYMPSPLHDLSARRGSCRPAHYLICRERAASRSRATGIRCTYALAASASAPTRTPKRNSKRGSRRRCASA